MSSYIVDAKTINRIVSYIMNGWDTTKHTIAPFPVSDEAFQELGQKLWDMNAAAVNQRYGELNEAPQYHLVCDNVDEFQVLKSLQCFLYQCSEGNVPELDLYKQLRQVEMNIMRKLIDTMPQYKKAEWG